LLEPIIKKENFDSWAEYYWNYQYILADKFLIPWLSKHIPSFEGITLLDVGCGEGGTTAAFANAGAECYGTDIDEDRIRKSTEISGNEGIHFELLDVYNIYLSNSISNKKFDLIILRDVIEHLIDFERALKNLKRLLSSDGLIFMTFPPYYSAFGGHQQLAKAIPFIHLLPSPLYYWILSAHGGNEHFISKIEHIREVSLTISKLQRKLKSLNLDIIKKTSYFLRPSFKIRYGLPILKSHIISSIPLIRELTVSGCFILATLKKD